MALTILGLARAADKRKLNEEWMVLHNEGDRPLNLDGCSITVGRKGARPRVFHTFKAGTVLAPDEKVRLVSGSSGKKSQGEAPEEEGVRNVHLFLKAPYIDRPGVTVALTLRQRELCRATYEPETT